MTGIAVIGTGRMGAAMVVRLAETGHEVTAYNRSRSRADEVAARANATVTSSAAPAEGARIAVHVAETAAQAARVADVVIVSLADDRAVEETYTELVAGLRPGAIVLETSTIHPRTVRAVAAEVNVRQAILLDTPVSGSVSLVQRGELTIMAGGPAEAVQRARPVLDALATRVFHLGPLGSGATMKLAVNSVVHALNLAVSEALVLAERSGVDRALAYDVFAASAIGAPFVQYKRSAFVDPETAPVAFALDLVAKDLELISELGQDVGARMDQLAVTRKVVARAVAEGMGELDLSALAVLLRDRPE